MTTKSRLLGMALASADALAEIDADGRIAFALGAEPGGGVDIDAAWSGRPLVDCVGKASRKPLVDALAAVRPGVRSDPLDILLTCGEDRVRRGRLRLFQLAELAPATSCAVTYEGVPFTLSLPRSPALLDGDALLSRVQTALGGPASSEEMAIAFVEVPGLAEAGEPYVRASVRIQALLQSVSLDGSTAARLSTERFAVVRPADSPVDIANQVREAGAAEGLELLARTTEAALSRDRPAATIRALRFALEACLKDGGVEGAGLAFSDSLKQTLKDADRFQAVVRTRDFALQYQPIVDLSTGVTHHFEALARFDAHGPAASIRMAEELGLIESFDLAVAEKALQLMGRRGFGLTRIAINVSGVSLGGDAWVNGILRLTAPSVDARKRLLVEVTETAALADIEAANRRLSALRAVGIRVCLDDFGVGSASLDYLHRLPADSVKIDGRFVRDVDTDDRSRALVGRLVELCGDLNVTTIAEMIETPEQDAALRSLGVTYGQGWLHGRPMSEPVPAEAPASPARRRGERVSWA